MADPNNESLREFGLALPHGPNTTGRHVASQNVHDVHSMSENEKGVFSTILHPDDSYNDDGVYWADMGIAKRAAFVTKQSNAEAAKELRQIGAMIKKDPLSPVAWYFRNAVLPGAGLLMEGYVLFSIGNLKPLLEAGFKTCWKDHTVCNKTWVQSLDYLEICGIMVGQILVGVIGDWVGRRWGLIQDAWIMFLGLLGLIAAWGVTENGWVICYTWMLFFYSIGVGGEYPMTATAAMENSVGSGRISTREDRMHRGRKVTMAFLMQGWGQFLNQGLLILLLLIFHSGSGNPPYDKKVTQWVYRISFVPAAVGTLWLVYYRTYKMKSASKHLDAIKKKSNVTGYDKASLALTFEHFGARVIATAGAWYANDIFFYGNKLFQGEFIAQISPASVDNVMTGWLWNLLNTGIALLGYYLASFLIDNKLYGRKWMMVVGFMADFICFVIPALNYEYYTTTGIRSFQAMYFLSSFFNQFGPNSVTFIVAAEVYPTPIRATAHGFSAAAGKAGALTAAVLYNYISPQTRFLVVPWFGLAGALVTLLFLPDTTGLDLKEGERRWAFLREGRGSDYHGVAVHPKHLSWWERMRGVGKAYDPVLDYESRIHELRKDWEESMDRRGKESVGKHEGDDDDDTEWSSDVSTYFQRTKHGSDGGSPRNGLITDEKGVIQG